MWRSDERDLARAQTHADAHAPTAHRRRPRRASRRSRCATSMDREGKMGHRTREFRVEVRKLPKRARARPLVRQRARPTPERMRRAGADFERGDTGQITMRDSPLERALARNVITQEQYATGQKYRHHWYHAGLNDPIGSIDLARISGTDLGAFSGMAKTENQLFHRQRYREAVQAIGKIGSH